MATGDGLLARIRVREGRLSPDQMAGTARAAASFGSGLIEITSRGNLQVRGLTAASAPGLAVAVRDLVAVETGLVVDVSPLAGDDPQEIDDPRPLAQTIRAGASGLMERLAPKMAVVVDGGGQIGLGQLKADIRLEAMGGGEWSVTLGSAKPQRLDRDSAVATVMATLAALAALGPDARASTLFAGPARPPHIVSFPGVGPIIRRGGTSFGIALPFSSAPSTALLALAQESAGMGIQAMRLAPGHGLLVDDAPAAFAAMAERLGFIVHQGDPRLRISACAGSDGCASGLVPARRLAAQLASHLGSLADLHVSGCHKGCAHPGPSAVTLVGSGSGVGLVIGGRAGDTPAQIVEPGVLPALLAEMQDHG